MLTSFSYVQEVGVVLFMQKEGFTKINTHTYKIVFSIFSHDEIRVACIWNMHIPKRQNMYSGHK